jgi:hypothetical protein
MTMGTMTVGRPKKIAKKGATPPKTIGFRVSGEYGEWLDGLARHHRTTVAGVMDRAIAEWAEGQGYPAKAPERMP